MNATGGVSERSPDPNLACLPSGTLGLRNASVYTLHLMQMTASIRTQQLDGLAP